MTWHIGAEAGLSWLLLPVSVKGDDTRLGSVKMDSGQSDEVEEEVEGGGLHHSR